LEIIGWSRRPATARAGHPVEGARPRRDELAASPETCRRALELVEPLEPRGTRTEEADQNGRVGFC
jgi:hypothetical protein